MFISPLDTTVGRTLKGMDKVLTALGISYVDGSLSGTAGTESRQSVLLELLGGKKLDTDVPSFGHPLVLPTVMDGNKVVVDQRTYANVPPANTRYVSQADVKNEREYSFLQNRGLFQIGWQALGPRAFEGLGKVPIRVYSDWLAGQISVNRGLDDSKRQEVAIYAAWFYLCQFCNGLSASDHLPMIRLINSATRIDFVTLTRVIDSIKDSDLIKNKYIPNIAAFCEAVRGSGISPRLNALWPPLLFEITAYSWVGGKSKEVAGIALEHPPTFILLCSSADGDRGYKDTVIARLMKEQRKFSSDIDNFQFNVKHHLEKCRGVERL